MGATSSHIEAYRTCISGNGLGRLLGAVTESGRLRQGGHPPEGRARSWSGVVLPMLGNTNVPTTQRVVDRAGEASRYDDREESAPCA